ncbi:hypothetical protein [Nocardia sp. CA-135398]|uniref:hypothetical protein n=1 Tax=Nocardia sp. CA-135398 TaxID=3239977 RepID=UPI003D95B541
MRRQPSRAGDELTGAYARSIEGLGHLYSAPKIIAAVAGVFVLAACSSGESVTPTAEFSSPTVATSTVAACTKTEFYARNPDEKYLTAEISKMQFPSGTCLFMVDTGDALDKPETIHVTVSLDVADSKSPDDLRPVATDIAHVLKKTVIGLRISVVDIDNWGTAKPKYRTLLTDENFQEHPWNGVPSREAETAIWKIVDPA